jgi:hypothetical protein
MMTFDYDRDAALCFLLARFPTLERGERIEIRALDRNRAGAVVARDFLSSPEEAADYVGTLDMGWEVYYGINPRLGRDGTKQGVSRILTSWADLDYEKQGEEEVVRILNEYELPTTWQVDSGNGVHAYWAITPLDAGTNGPGVEQLLRGLYARLGNADRVQNIDRIFRLPGTFNNKYGRPRRVRVLEYIPSARYTLDRIRMTVPALPPVEKEINPSDPTLPGDIDLGEIKNLLTFISPTLPRDEYLAVIMAVHALHPDEEGQALVDEWSSEARSENGQTFSPRTEPGNWWRFKRSGQNGAIGAGTLYHYARRGGWVPPPRPVPLMKKHVREAGWRNELARAGELDTLRLPYWLGRHLDYLGDTKAPLPLDWSVQSVLCFWSFALAPWRFENLGLNRWMLGVARSNAGKNVITDALYEVWKRVQLAGGNKMMTSGSPEGMWKELDGTGERLLAYHREFAGYLRSFQRDFMGTARDALCNLYDGADVHHVLAKRTIRAVDPYLVVIATTTPAGVAKYMQMDDVLSGYVNRFGIVFADHTDLDVEDRPTRMQAQSLADEITRHVAPLGRGGIVRFDAPRGETPVPWREFCREIGIGSGKIYRAEESVDEMEPALGRLRARVKKDAGLLESMEEAPQLDGHTLVIRESNLRLAIQLTQRGKSYASGMEGIINVSADERLMEKIKRVLRDTPEPLSKSILRSRVHADIRPFDTALTTMIEEGSIGEVSPAEGQRAHRYKLSG